jgi:hypothetical protein
MIIFYLIIILVIETLNPFEFLLFLQEFYVEQYKWWHTKRDRENDFLAAFVS